MFAAIGHDAWEFNTSPSQARSLVSAARRSQWANGILTQAPRLIHEWEQTGLTVPPEVALTADNAAFRVPSGRPAPVRLTLRNGAHTAMEDLGLSCMVRGDWRAEVADCPQRLDVGAQAAVGLACQAPPRLMRYALQNDLAHVHVLARYRLGTVPCVTWAALRLESE